MHVTDHALIRYLERHHGFDLDKYRRELMTKTVREAIRAGATSVKMKGGTLVLRGSTVVTFKP